MHAGQVDSAEHDEQRKRLATLESAYADAISELGHLRLHLQAVGHEKDSAMEQSRQLASEVDAVRTQLEVSRRDSQAVHGHLSEAQDRSLRLHAEMSELQCRLREAKDAAVRKCLTRVDLS